MIQNDSLWSFFLWRLKNSDAVEKPWEYILLHFLLSLTLIMWKEAGQARILYNWSHRIIKSRIIFQVYILGQQVKICIKLGLNNALTEQLKSLDGSNGNVFKC